MAAAAIVTTNEQKKCLIDQFRSVVIALAGEDVACNHGKTKDKEVLMYQISRGFLEDPARINILLRAPLEKRENLFQPHILLVPFDEDIIVELKSRFPQNPSTDTVKKYGRNTVS